MVVFLSVIAYIIITFLIGSVASKRVISVSDYFVAKKNLGVFAIISLLFGEFIAGTGTIGAAAEAYAVGISSVWMNWSSLAGCIVIVIFMVAFYRKMDAMTLAETYNVRFDNKCRMVLLLITVVVYFIIFSMQPLAGAAIFAPMLGISKTAMVWIMSGLFILLSMIGGLRGIAWMNVMHSFVMFIGLAIVAIICINNAGGIAQIQAELSPSYFNLLKPGLHTIVAWVLGGVFSLIAAPTVALAIFGSKDVKAAKKGVLIAGILLLPFSLIPAFIGLSAKIILPNIDSQTALFSVANYLGPSFSVLASIGVIAAIMSTAPAVLLIAATTLTRDFYKVYIRPKASDIEELVFSRIITVVFGVLATFSCLFVTSILQQTLGALQIRSITGIVLLVALYWKKVDANAAFWSMLTGGVIAAVWHFAQKPFGVEPLWPALLVSLPVLIILTLTNKLEISPGYEMVQSKMLIR